MRTKNLVGNIYGRLEVLSLAVKTSGKKNKWLCKCSCGNEKIIVGKDLTRSIGTKSCGCLARELRSINRTKDLSGKTFGRLTVLSKALVNQDKHVWWSCKCSCGTVKDIRGVRLTAGHTKSCGCLADELTSIRSTKDYTGQTINHVTFLSNTKKKDKQGNYIWNCRCECGKEFTTAAYIVTRKASAARSCGCYTIDRIHKLQVSRGYGISKSAKKFLDEIEKELSIKIAREVKISNRYFDGGYKKHLIEIDSTYWHGIDSQKQVDTLKNQLAKEAGYTLLRFTVDSLKDVPKALQTYRTSLQQALCSQ